ncbi:FAD-dependent oxidoreductase [Salidesulfovibrio brasiliensis]|uniref:FAD-dependent oxidoreductase n=1 Tax=Salidesulfovibrio brasiliensis TaxID=221711 RepID=UPI0006D0AA26|nr:FAD-dependent oxidoreductase [Salidesulfovibrio brasiliensis]
MDLFKSSKVEEEWLLPEESRKHLSEHFEKMRYDVHFEVFTSKDMNPDFNEYAVRFLRDLSRLGGKISFDQYELDSDKARERGVDASPTLLVNPDEYDIRFQGAPLGEEGQSFITAIMLVSLRQSGLSEDSRGILAELDQPRSVDVFVSPTCPYCPGQVISAIKCAIEKPGLVSARCIETGENEALARKHNVGGVPLTVVNDGEHRMDGLFPEERFVAELVTLQDASELMARHDHSHDHAEEVDLVIVGAGPAGLTAGIYAERAGLSAVVLEKGIVGGQVALTPNVENYPGFPSVPGMQLMDIMSQHAREYVNVHESESVEEIKIGRNIEVLTDRRTYLCKSVILTTGAVYRKLGIPGEDEFYGNGVSFCASCDGYIYKGRKVAVVGGGNTALTDALHLAKLGADVTVIHRRDTFRAQKALVESLEEQAIPVVWNTVVEEVVGEDGQVTTLKLRNVLDDATDEMAVDGVFVAVGQEPGNALAQMIGLNMDGGGFVKVDGRMRTSIPRVYAAGDITGGLQQIVTAIAEGSIAAMSAFEDMSSPYWKQS